MELYNLETLNTKLIENKRLLFSQGFFYSDFEKNGELYLMQKLLPDIDVMIDIGSNIGHVSKLGYTINESIDFHLFDILAPEKVEVFSDKMTYYQKIMTENANEKMEIFSIPEDKPFDTTEVSSVFKRTDYNVKDDELIATQFDTESLDHFSAQFDKEKNFFLKIDTEGSEISILKGAKNFFKNNKVLGYLEYNPTAWGLGGHNYKDLYRFFLTMDYSLFRLTPLGLKEISYYHDINEPLFCYYFFAKKGVINSLDFKTGEIERKTGINKSSIYLF